METQRSGLRWDARRLGNDDSKLLAFKESPAPVEGTRVTRSLLLQTRPEASDLLGFQNRDMDLFMDEDKTRYVLTQDAGGHARSLESVCHGDG